MGGYSDDSDDYGFDRRRAGGGRRGRRRPPPWMPRGNVPPFDSCLTFCTWCCCIGLIIPMFVAGSVVPYTRPAFDPLIVPTYTPSAEETGMLIILPNRSIILANGTMHNDKLYIVRGYSGITGYDKQPRGFIFAV